jgi:flavorubredoxin
MPDPFEIAKDTFCAPVLMPIPGYGLLNVNTFVIRGEQPMLIDTNAPIYRKEFLDAVFTIVDPKDLRWLFITHEDRDHSGNIPQVLEMCPNATVVHNFLGFGKLAEEFSIPPDRMRLVNDGEILNLGDREITAVRPPLYDAGTTRGVWDPTTSVYFSSDCFGANLEEGVENVNDASPDEFEAGFFWMNRINHAWHEVADPAKFKASVDRIRALGAETIASSHGPMAKGRTDQLLDLVELTPNMEPVRMPTHDEFMGLIGQPATPPAPATG